MSNSTEQFIKIPLSKQGKYAGLYEAIISPEDADLAELRWSAGVHEHGKRVYAQRTNPSKMLNRVIMERVVGRKLKRSEYVDHINNNSLDNRRVNLRIVTNRQNSWNSRSFLGETKYRGVSFHKKTGKYRARIHIDGQEIHLGLYETPKEAYNVYCQVAVDHFGEYANLGYGEVVPDNRLDASGDERATQKNIFGGISIPLSKNGKYAGRYEAVVDTIDSDLTQDNWSVHGVRNSKNTIYVVKRDQDRNILMHVIIMERILKRKMKPGECVDHIDGDGLNNRRDNLRIATVTQNNWNVGMYSHNTTGYKGVSYDKRRNKYRATITVGNKAKYLGRFDTVEEAHEAYCKAVEKYRGKFGNTG